MAASICSGPGVSMDAASPGARAASASTAATVSGIAIDRILVSVADYSGEAVLGGAAGGATADGAGAADFAAAFDRARLILFFSTCEARKTRTLRGRIGASSPVFGLRPMRWPF